MSDFNKDNEYDKIKEALSKQTPQFFDGEIKKAKRVEEIITPSGKHYRVPNPTHEFNKYIDERDKQEAEIELSYIRAAIALAHGSNDISCEIHIGSLPPIGISVNKRIIDILLAEAKEIEKYLRGEENNYE